MLYEHLRERLVDLMAANNGHLSADVVERDSELADNRELVSAAARELASEPDVVCGEEKDGREWFPYSYLTRP
jgi:hypothetical protein